MIVYFALYIVYSMLYRCSP